MPISIDHLPDITLVGTARTMPPDSSALKCDTKSRIWLIGEEEYFFDQSQRSPAGTLVQGGCGIKPIIAAYLLPYFGPYKSCRGFQTAIKNVMYRMSLEGMHTGQVILNTK